MIKAFEEHLGDSKTYAPLNDRAFDSMMSLLRCTLDHWVSKFHSTLKTGDKQYLRTVMNLAPGKLAKFRMPMKVHKTPFKTRPIVCCVGTFMNTWSRWLDYYLRMLTPFIKSYTKDTSTVIDFVWNISDLPPNAMIFTADADSMYTNIDTDHAIKVIGDWLFKIKDDPAFPKIGHFYQSKKLWKQS